MPCTDIDDSPCILTIMSPRSVLITGCNRGIGLELIKQWLKVANPPTHLIGTYRDPALSEELLTLTKDNSDRYSVGLSKIIVIDNR
jgi:NAD(P)-dependent dehydrogenase (short-subunit alcohol dehydrogenase family)